MKVFLNYDNTRTVIKKQTDESNWLVDNVFVEKNVSISKADTEYNIPFKIDFIPIDNKIYVVKASYSSGDSFGVEKNIAEYINLFKTVEEAKNFKIKVQLITDLNNKDWYGTNTKEKERKINSLKEQLNGEFAEENSWGKTYLLIQGTLAYRFPWFEYFQKLNQVQVIELDFVTEA